MTSMKTLAIGTHVLLVFAWLGPTAPHGLAAVEPQTSQKAAAPAAKPAATAADALDRLLAPIALYPDQLLAQMLLCAANPGKVATLGEWLASQTLKGTELQDAATKSGFEPSFVALVLFPRGRGGDGRRSGLDDQARPGVHCRSLGGLRQHPAAESQGAGCREAQDHAATGRSRPGPRRVASRWS